MNLFNHLRFADDEIIVAAPKFFAAEICGGGVVVLNAGAHRAIKDEDAVGESIEVAAVEKRLCHGVDSRCYN